MNYSLNLLSICIPTINRSKLLKTTLTKLFSFNLNMVEVVIVDGSDNNDTKNLIKKEFSDKNIVYYQENKSIKIPTNHGFDNAYNLAVEKSNSKYCWLLTDDDLLIKESINTIMSYIKYNYDLIIAGSIIKNKNLTKTYIRSRPNINKNLIFKPTEINEFAKIVNDQLTYIGCVIIKKSVWLKSDKKKYFGTGFVHVGVIFDRLLSNDILVIKKPLTIIRFGDGLWTNRHFKYGCLIGQN